MEPVPILKARKTRAQITLFSLAFFCFYFGQKLANNFEGLSKIPVREALNTEFGLSAADTGALLASISLGWYIKALLGTVTDGLPIFGLRRKPWLVIGNLVASGAWFWVAEGGASTKETLALGLMVVNLGVAFTDVIVDGLMVQSAQKLEAEGRLSEGTLTRSFQSWQWFGANVAVTLAALAGGAIAAVFNVSMAATISGFSLLILLPLIFLVREDRVAWDWTLARRGFAGIILAVLVGWYYLWSNGLAEGHWFAPYKEWTSPFVVVGAMLLVVRIPRSLWAPMALIFGWQFTPFLRDSTVFFTYFTEDNHAFVDGLKTDTFLIPLLQQVVVTLKIATPEALATKGFQTLFYGSVVETVFALGAILACLFTARNLSRMSFGSLFRWCLVGNGLSFLAFMAFPLGSTSPSLLLVTVAFSGFVYMAAVLAIVGYAGARTPKVGQASIFAFMMGLSNLGVMLGAETIGAKLYTNLSGTLTEVGADGAEITKLVDPNLGFFLLGLIGVGSLVLVWGLVKLLEIYGYIDSKQE